MGRFTASVTASEIYVSFRESVSCWVIWVSATVVGVMKFLHEVRRS